MKTIEKLIVATCLVLFTISCKKEVKPSSTIIQETPQNLKNWDKTVQAVAKDVSIKLNSIVFRKMLKHEVSLSFDGDANILISSMMNRLPKYFEYENQIASRNPTEQELLSGFNFDILQQAAIDFPQMQIAVQTDVESWDPVTFVPKVVYLTSNYDENMQTDVNGFDGNQGTITVSTQFDPVDNYVVISQNERTIQRTGDVLRLRSSECPVEVLMSNATYNPEIIPAKIVPENCGGGTGGGGGTPPPYIQYIGIGHNGVLPSLIDSIVGTTVPLPPNGTFNKLDPVGTFNGTTVYRKDNKHEKMRFIRCDNIGQIEGWPAGAPEIRLHVFEQSNLNPSNTLQIFKEQFEPSKRKDIKDKWWDAEGVTMHLWDYQGTGTKSGFGYYEYDPVLIPNETVVAIGQLTVDILAITSVIPTGNPTQVAIYGSIRQSVATGIRSLKKQNGMSEYIGKDDYSIFNDEDQFNHNPGGTKFKTSPDL